MGDEMDRGDRVLFLLVVAILVALLCSCSTKRKTIQREATKIETVTTQSENKGMVKVENKATDTQTEKEVTTTVIEYDTEKPIIEGKQPVKKETKTVEKIQVIEKEKVVIQAKDTVTNKIETNIQQETKTEVKEIKSTTNYMPLIIWGLSALAALVALWYAKKTGWLGKIFKALRVFING